MRLADATVRFAKNFFSAGERCTMTAIRKWNKRHLDVKWETLRGSPEERAAAAEEFRQFLARHAVSVLNVAGNSDDTCSGIGVLVENFLVEALQGHLA